jgi:hypothetical protein
MIARVNSWRRLSRAERRDVLAFASLIPLAAALVRTAGFRRVQRALERSPQMPPAGDAPSIERTLARGLARARRHAPYPGNCLSQSIALCWLLRRRGVPASLRLGARIDAGAFSAHAWVESGDRVINETPDVTERFTPFQPQRVPGAAVWQER